MRAKKVVFDSDGQELRIGDYVQVGFDAGGIIKKLASETIKRPAQVLLASKDRSVDGRWFQSEFVTFKPFPGTHYGAKPRLRRGGK